MHEVSLTRELLSQVKQAMLQHQVERVSGIQIEIGPLSGVEPLLVEQAFYALIRETGFADTCLTVQLTQLTAVCLDCQHEFEVVDFQFYCAACSSSRVQVTSGDQLRLLSIKSPLAEDVCISQGAIVE